MARRAGIAADDLTHAANDVVAILRSDGQLGHREIEAIMTQAGASTDLARLGLKHAWEAGDVVYRDRTRSWHREIRTFVHANSVSGFETYDPSEAATSLVVEYFSRYGPATLRDASWWSGLSQATITSVLRSHAAIAVRTPWSDSTCYMFTEQYESLLNYRPSDQTSVAFLAHEDVALKAYFETRSRYLGSLPQSRAFNQIGEVKPTVVRDGQVVGLWSWDPSARRVRYGHFGAVSSYDTALARTAASNMTSALRAGYQAVSF